MKQRIINERQEHTVETATNAGLVDLFLKFERGFRAYTSSRLGEKERYSTANFNQYVGYLERACHAAQTMVKEYDLGIGIARKGLWLSYVFSLYGMPTHDLLLIRTSDETRFSWPLTLLSEADVKNKKVLIFDNDLITGNTIDRVAQSMHDACAQKIGLLLIYGNTRITPEFYNQIRPSLKNALKIVGKTKKGDVVLNTEAEIPLLIQEYKSLEKDFNPSPKHLHSLAQILGIAINE